MRRLPARQPLHAPRPGRPRRAAAAVPGARDRGRRRRGHEQRHPRRPAAGQPLQLPPAPAEIVERARRLAAVCARHGVPLRAAADAVPARPPGRRVAGRRGPHAVDHLDEYPALLRAPDPAGSGRSFGTKGCWTTRRARPRAAMIVDAHHHFWDPATADYPWLTDELAVIRRRFGARRPRAGASRPRASRRRSCTHSHTPRARLRGVCALSSRRMCDLGLRRRHARDRDAERRAGHVVEPGHGGRSRSSPGRRRARRRRRA